MISLWHYHSNGRLFTLRQVAASWDKIKRYLLTRTVTIKLQQYQGFIACLPRDLPTVCFAAGAADRRCATLLG